MLDRYRWWRMTATILVIGMNMLAVFLPLFGVSTGELSDQRPTLVTPAWYAFTIWSVIYLGLIAVTFAILLKKIDLTESHMMRYCLSCVANILWLVARHSETIWASLLCMLILLWSLIMLCRELMASDLPRWVSSVFLVYLGWISIASLINTIVFFAYDLGREFFNTISFYCDRDHWGWWCELLPLVPSLLLIVAWIINLCVMFFKQRGETSLVAIWALIAVMVAQQDSVIQYIAGAVIATLLAGYGMMIYRRFDLTDW